MVGHVPISRSGGWKARVRTKRLTRPRRHRDVAGDRLPSYCDYLHVLAGHGTAGSLTVNYFTLITNTITVKGR